VPDLPALLQRLCSSLSQIEHELKQLARQQGGRPVEVSDRRLLAEAHGAVDRVRHLLWPYVEATAQRATGIDQALQKYRMERVTAMLHDLSDRVGEPQLAAVPEAQSFFSDIQKIATTAVEKHLERTARTPSPEAETVLN